MVLTRASVKKTDFSETDSEGKQSKIEITSTKELYVESDEDSDDEAPEAISTSTAKSSALQTAQAKREAQAKLAAEEKEKRRLRDQRLKEQKQTSKKATKSKKEEVKDTIDEEAEADNDTAEPEAPKTGELPKLLPQDFLQQYAKEEKAEKKRMHLSAKDFERIAEEEELKEQKQNSKKRHLSQGRQVGEYTVKVLSKRPKPQPIDQSLVDFRNQHFSRVDIPRRDAVLNASQGRKGGATTFARSGTVSNKRK
ncbi:hypothetical protein K450DRAFT_226672 [Umbelopsis ramanniana AG]|uniref:Uncharacterized protein n=1 Tax=Umbelopsis ramanniana AG TaxID=1314678 RepID=A0AAD5HFR7_UMBRA|nr:uncharacterized protein K450DRAFT_226672 [Umbelopsis ramanniana AG]KAI8582737.1 hypothetical protein K450DRAFT_226672 [Umbelopsis ramanniana AG]